MLFFFRFFLVRLWLLLLLLLFKQSLSLLLLLFYIFYFLINLSHSHESVSMVHTVAIPYSVSVYLCVCFKTHRMCESVSYLCSNSCTYVKMIKRQGERNDGDVQRRWVIVLYTWANQNSKRTEITSNTQICLFFIYIYIYQINKSHLCMNIVCLIIFNVQRIAIHQNNNKMRAAIGIRLL